MVLFNMGFTPKGASMNMRGLMVKAFKLVWKMVFLAMDIVLTAALDKRRTPRYSALKAQILHEDGLISDAEYRRSLGNDY